MPAPQDDGPPAGPAVRTPARVVLALLVGLLLWAQVPALLGWEATVVMSGSMAPAVAAGDVVVVRPVTGTPEVGQVLLVDDPDLPGTSRLHRLSAVETGGLRLQGDANATPDTSLVALAAVHGEGVLRVPLVGLPVLWAADRRWLPLAVTAGALLALVAAAAGPRTTTTSGTDEPARSPRPRGPGRHAAPPARRAGRVRRLAVAGVLVAVCSLLVEQPTRAGATFSASTQSTDASLTMDAVLAWGCVHETGTVAATRFYSLRETTGTAVYNTGTLADPTAQYKGNGRLRGGVTPGAVGPDCGRGTTGAVTLDGATGWISTNLSAPASDDVTTQVWFRTSTPGGVLFGLNGMEVDSGQHDRHVYMTDTGELVFCVYSGGTHTVASPTGTSYADGRWHLATATLGATGMRLYVDGAEVAADPARTTGEPMDFSQWRFGWTPLGNWDRKPTNVYFTGDLASAAVFGRALTATEVAGQYLLVA